MDSPYRTPDPPDPLDPLRAASRSDRRCSPLVLRECPARVAERARWEGAHRALSAVLLVALAGASGVALLGGVGVIAEVVRLASASPAPARCSLAPLRPLGSADAARLALLEEQVAALRAPRAGGREDAHAPDAILRRAQELARSGLPVSSAEVRVSESTWRLLGDELLDPLHGLRPYGEGALYVKYARDAAKDAGLRAGDVITAINGYAGGDMLPALDADYARGEPVALDVYRGGRHVVVVIRPARSSPAAP